MPWFARTKQLNHVLHGHIEIYIPQSLNNTTDMRKAIPTFLLYKEWLSISCSEKQISCGRGKGMPNGRSFNWEGMATREHVNAVSGDAIVRGSILSTIDFLGNASLRLQVTLEI